MDRLHVDDLRSMPTPIKPSRHPFELWPVVGWLIAGLVTVIIGPGPTVRSAGLGNDVLTLLVLLMALAGVLYLVGAFGRYSRDPVMAPALELAAMLAGAGSLSAYAVVIVNVTPYGWGNFGFWWCASLLVACLHRGVQLIAFIISQLRRAHSS